jgi:hypothetical protein
MRLDNLSDENYKQQWLVSEVIKNIKDLGEQAYMHLISFLILTVSLALFGFASFDQLLATNYYSNAAVYFAFMVYNTQTIAKYFKLYFTSGDGNVSKSDIYELSSGLGLSLLILMIQVLI